MSEDEIQDPLKPFNEICLADERQKHFLGSLEDNHSYLSSIILNDTVPLDVRQLFETAKNLSLYSWFAYRFHQVSELISYSALEMALREKYKKEYPGRKSPMLAGLLQHAKKHGWIRNEDFSNRDRIALSNAEQKKMYEVIESGVLKEGESVPVEEPTKEEINEAFESLDLVTGIVESSAKLRNALAHGSNMLHPNSISTLAITAEAINSIYRKN